MHFHFPLVPQFHFLARELLLVGCLVGLGFFAATGAFFVFGAVLLDAAASYAFWEPFWVTFSAALRPRPVAGCETCYSLFSIDSGSPSLAVFCDAPPLVFLLTGKAFAVAEAVLLAEAPFFGSWAELFAGEWDLRAGVSYAATTDAPLGRVAAPRFFDAGTDWESSSSGFNVLLLWFFFPLVSFVGSAIEEFLFWSFLAVNT